MGAKPFKNFSADEVIGQINCGLDSISNPFTIEEPATLFEKNVQTDVLKHFEGSNTKIDIERKDGYLIFTATRE
ncbi:hypothetical protein LLI22_000201 [Acinetobacter baumannii]|uniref:hypothetical protein n=1 Tax=Acinetobacter baumannii TaxID=470 RepID=UPI001D2AD888|nr:hypothetical protein [Acinetobacter baumannii]EHZ7942094.1 hypothetical protein [Acinetobacter baumannii]EKU8073844.1 hypothetical protein [Acinetobacter baumannii]EKV2719983.1 hypothetical protein [Acinetobacter baumannii]